MAQFHGEVKNLLGLCLYFHPNILCQFGFQGFRVKFKYLLLTGAKWTLSIRSIHRVPPESPGGLPVRLALRGCVSLALLAKGNAAAVASASFGLPASFWVGLANEQRMTMSMYPLTNGQTSKVEVSNAQLAQHRSWPPFWKPPGGKEKELLYLEPKDNCPF